MGRIKKAQDGKLVNTKSYLDSSRKRVKAVTDSARAQELKKGIRTYEDYLNKKIKEKPVKKQRSGGKIAPKKSNVSKKLGSAKKTIGNMRFTKKKK
jgi:3-methyladenine DNA glycosylase Tag